MKIWVAGLFWVVVNIMFLPAKYTVLSKLGEVLWPVLSRNLREMAALSSIVS